MSTDLQNMLALLRSRRGAVIIEPLPALTSASEDVASQLAQSRRLASDRGARAAKLYNNLDPWRERRTPEAFETEPAMRLPVTEAEARQLMVAGAEWAGPIDQAPANTPYVDRLAVVNYGCIDRVELALTPLHALIGPNDSGKSTLLSAFQWMATREGWHTARADTAMQVRIGDQAVLNHLQRGYVCFKRYQPIERAAAEDNDLIQVHGEQQHLFQRFRPTRLLRLDPDVMRSPTNLIPHSEAISFSTRGDGLASVYDAFLSRNLDAFLSISERFRDLFPTAKSIELTNPSKVTKSLGVKLVTGSSITTAQVSEGMLYWLAFAALPYIAPTPILLIEEPENGLHPSRIAEVMRVLRDVSRTTQVIVATHSPLVINELFPDEVTVITRTVADGTIATPLTSTKNFQQRAQIYALGELWLNYADGNLESDLVAPSTLPPNAHKG